MPVCPSDPRPRVRKRSTSWLVELGVPGDVPLVVLATGGVLGAAASSLSPAAGSGEAHQTDRAPEVEHAEDQSNHDDVPGAMTDCPRGQEQFGNAMKCCAKGNVLQHKLAMGEQE